MQWIKALLIHRAADWASATPRPPVPAAAKGKAMQNHFK
jgi:hypothetical protein